MNLNLETADRDVFNAFDWVRELGGFTRGLRTIFSLMLIVITYRNYETYMVSHLYQKPEDDQEGKDGKEVNELKQSQVNTCKMFFFDCLPEGCLKALENKNCWRLCRRTKSYHYFDKGQEKYL